MYSYGKIVVILQGRAYGPLYHTTSPLPGLRRTLLLLGRCRTHCLNKVKMAFGVGELLNLLDLQAPVFVGDDMVDEDRFADRLNTRDHGLQLGGDL